ncbi:MAG: hypothetical protein WBA13_02350 [Microcoleaceae cyanobacterium]
MKPVKVYLLTLFFSAEIGVQPSRSASLALPLSIQIQQVTDWFTGLFNNNHCCRK